MHSRLNNHFLVYLALFTCFSALAAACDCTIYPYKPDPPCFEECSAKLLAKLDVDSLVKVVGLRLEVAQKITAIPPNKKPDNISGYARVLPDRDFNELIQRLQSLSQKEFQLLLKGAE